MFKPRCLMTQEDMRIAGEMSGKMIQWMLEGRSRKYMAEQFNQSSWKVDYNIEEMLYILLKEVGIKEYLKVLLRR